MPSDPQALAHTHSLASPSAFWHTHAQQLHWSTPYTAALHHDAAAASWTWFPGGRISASYNLVTRHVLAGNGARTAIIWDSPVTGMKRRITYRELQEEVEVLAEVLRQRGVARGDRVLVYMPMIPECQIALLAITHLGAIHTVVFGGFAPAECSKRIDSAAPKLVLTASCGIEGGAGGKRRVIPYLPLVREAIDKSAHKPQNTLLWQREEMYQALDKGRGELGWNKLVRSERVRRGMTGVGRVEGEQGAVKRVKIPGGGGCVEVGEAFPSEDPQYIIYTSGTTGKPKGVVRTLGGHLVGLSYTAKTLFNLTPSSTIFCASDLGWVVGHSYIHYSPLLLGATTVLFEGKPIGTPDASTFWRIVEDYKVDVLSTAPTALRAIHREDPELRGLAQHDTSSLKALFLAGERSEAGIVDLFQKRLWGGGDGAGTVVDNWWSSESGSPMTGVCLGLSPRPRIKPGSAGRPLPGWDIRIVDDAGRRITEAGKMGNIVLGLPLAPTGFRGLWAGDDDAEGMALYNKAYKQRFGKDLLDTGDAGYIDADGFVNVMSRTDDVINVAAHRFSTGAMEGVVLGHAGIGEAYVVPCPDSLKGHGVDEGVLLREVNELVRREIGPIAVLGGLVVLTKVPRTRSGKTLRRVMREVLERVVAGGDGKGVEVPATIDDATSVESVRSAVVRWWKERGAVVKAKM
ncbi:hypothetical protein DFP73DRAFT_575081 [Morchella snyderi]|nr:hypothetical protein DFP73DRAFT_575081 [Morchella snyderi]